MEQLVPRSTVIDHHAWHLPSSILHTQGRFTHICHGYVGNTCWFANVQYRAIIRELLSTLLQRVHHVCDEYKHWMKQLVPWSTVIDHQAWHHTSRILHTAVYIFTLQWRHNGHDGVSIISLTIVYSTIYSGADQRKNEVSASLAFVGPVTRKMFIFDDVIMSTSV